MPLAAMPNIGLASLAGNRIVYPHATPEYFAEFAAHARELGACVIGGCCGTTPSEIAAIASAVKEERAPTEPFVIAGQRIAARPQGKPTETRLARDLREGTWIVSVQIDPPLGGDYTGLVEMSRTIKESGKAGFVDINDNATGRAAMSGMVMAAAIERHVGIETIPHLTARDYSVLGLEGLLLGGHAEGVRNVLAVTGDPAEVGDYPGARGIWEVDSIGLVKLMAALNRGQNYVGKAIDAPTSFFIGVAVNPTADDLDLEVERYRQKIAEGAHFAMTQILYDMGYYDAFWERFGGPSPIPVLIGLFPLSTYRLALTLHNEVPGIIVPDELQAAMRDAGPDASAVGMEHASELYRHARDRAAGVYVATPFRRPLAALDVLA
jgi:homocysteine S-methyltransferase